MLKFKELILLLIIFFITNNAFGIVKIKYKINDEIITNIDILNEKKYLTFLRPNLKKLSNEEIDAITTSSLIREIIKKKEIDRIFKNKDNLNFIEDVKKNLFKFKKVKNEEEFKKLIKNTDIKYDIIIEKIKYEALWNELIFSKYSSLIKINEKNLRQNLVEKISSEKKYEYNLSEILFEIENNEDMQNKLKLIINYIKSSDFKTAASRYSISSSANKGGQIGWIKETLLSNNLNLILGKMKINEVSKPIKYPNGYLILKINDKKEMKEVINIQSELNEIINFEKNKQLNQFSLLYYKKLKQNTVIDEY